MKHIIRSMSPLFLFALLIIIGAGLGVIAKKTQQEKSEALMRMGTAAAPVDPCARMVSSSALETEMFKKTCRDLENIANTNQNLPRKCAAKRVLEEKIREKDRCEVSYHVTQEKRSTPRATFQGISAILQSIIPALLAAPKESAGKKEQSPVSSKNTALDLDITDPESTTIEPGTLSLPPGYIR